MEVRRSSKVREKARAMSSEGIAGVGGELIEVTSASVLRREAIDTCWEVIVLKRDVNGGEDRRRRGGRNN